jgi:hypothetical protein
MTAKTVVINTTVIQPTDDEADEPDEEGEAFEAAAAAATAAAEPVGGNSDAVVFFSASFFSGGGGGGDDDDDVFGGGEGVGAAVPGDSIGTGARDCRTVGSPLPVHSDASKYTNDIYNLLLFVRISMSCHTFYRDIGSQSSCPHRHVQGSS